MFITDVINDVASIRKVTLIREWNLSDRKFLAERNYGRDPFVETDFCFESETGFSFGMYVKQTVSIQLMASGINIYSQ